MRYDDIAIRVLIPGHYQPCLGQAIASVLPQLRSHDELWVCDDGPQPREHATLLQHFAHPQLIHMSGPATHDSGGSQFTHMQNQLRDREFDGYVMYLDGDDQLLLDALTQVRYLASQHFGDHFFCRMDSSPQDGLSRGSRLHWKVPHVFVDGNIRGGSFALYSSPTQPLPAWTGGRGQDLRLAHELHNRGDSISWQEVVIAIAQPWRMT